MPHRRFSGTGNGHSSRDFPRRRKRARMPPARRVKRRKRVGKEKEKKEIRRKNAFFKSRSVPCPFNVLPSAFQSRFQGRFALSPRAKGRFRPCKERGKEDSPPCPHIGANRFQNFVREPFFKSLPMQKELRECAKPLPLPPAKRMAGD